VVSAEDVTLFGRDINRVRESTEALLHANGNVGQEINAEETKCMFMSHHQNSRQKPKYK